MTTDRPTGDELLAMLSALDSPWRIRILAILARGNDYVSNIAREVGISRPLVHMHLKRLEEAGLVAGRLELSDDGKALKYFDVVPFTLTLTPETFITAVETLTEKGSTP
jgi:ArsR family transcriptional regulator